MLNTLYIIGNGFDRYHGLDTRYQSFALYLKKNYGEIYDLLIEYYGLPDLDVNDPNSYYDPLWADFESALANLDFETVLDDNTDYLANPGDPDFSDRDWHAYQFEMERIVDNLTKEMAKAFKEFILAVSFPTDADAKLIKFESNSVFLNFNYTDTLQKYYGINSKRILYLHGKAKKSLDEIILGHGVDPKTFEEKEELPPKGLSIEQLNIWREQKSDSGNYSYESGKSELMSYFKTSYKSTQDIIKQNNSFFKSLKKVNKIIVLGHSISEVDQPYFKKIIASVNKRCFILRFLGFRKTQWIVSYYSDTERDSHLNKLTRMGLLQKQIKLLKIEELKPKQPTLF
ncbi:MAG: bacteriophage abortive infection AbiH family protein [Ferruginibacter sp.]